MDTGEGYQQVKGYIGYSKVDAVTGSSTHKQCSRYNKMKQARFLSSSPESLLYRVIQKSRLSGVCCH